MAHTKGTCYSKSHRNRMPQKGSSLRSTCATSRNKQFGASQTNEERKASNDADRLRISHSRAS